MHAGKDAAYWYGCSVVCLSATTASTTKTAEPIEVPFGEWTRVVLGNHVLNGVSDLPTEWGTFCGGFVLLHAQT